MVPGEPGKRYSWSDSPTVSVTVSDSPLGSVPICCCRQGMHIFAALGHALPLRAAEGVESGQSTAVCVQRGGGVCGKRDGGTQRGTMEPRSGLGRDLPRWSRIYRAALVIFQDKCLIQAMY